MSRRLRRLLLVVLVPLVFVAPNAGAVSTTLVINEVDYDQPSTDTAEFLELKNVSGSAISLNGWTVELFNGAGTVSAVYRTIPLPDVSLAAGDYFVICSNPATTTNCDLDGGPDTDLIQNGAPDAIGLRNTGALVDAVSYEGDSAAPYTEGSGVGLIDDASSTTGGLSRCPDGSDSDLNNVDFGPAAITPGVANDCPPPPGSVVINELDYDQPGTDTAEFVELKNVVDVADEPRHLRARDRERRDDAGDGRPEHRPPERRARRRRLLRRVRERRDHRELRPRRHSRTPTSSRTARPDAVGLRESGNLVDAVSYEGNTAAPYTEGSGAGLVDAGTIDGLSRCADGVDTERQRR